MAYSLRHPFSLHLIRTFTSFRSNFLNSSAYVYDESTPADFEFRNVFTISSSSSGVDAVLGVNYINKYISHV
jgi:hypothetical protein